MPERKRFFSIEVFPYYPKCTLCSGEKKWGEWKKMRFKAEVLAGRGEVLISIRLLVASCQTIRTPIRTNQATSCSPPPPFLFAFYPPTPWLTLTDVFVCSSQNYVKIWKHGSNILASVLKIEFGPPHAGFGSVWSPQKARKFRHNQTIMT